jgi:hypothetical protein
LEKDVKEKPKSLEVLRISLSQSIEDRGSKQPYMEDHHAKKNQKKSVKIKRRILNVRNVLSAFWVRFSIQANNGLEWLILDSRYYILFNFRVLLALVYLLFQMVKE